MLMALALLIELAQPTAEPVAAPPPDIQLDLRATARRVVIQNDGRADLQVRTAVNGREGDNNLVEVQAPQLPQGRTTLNNVEVRVRADARVPAPADQAEGQEPRSPQ